MVIDLPQAVDAPANNNVDPMLERDAVNLVNYLGHFAPEWHTTPYGKQIWTLCQSGSAAVKRISRPLRIWLKMTA